MVQYCGHHTGADRLVWRGDTAGRDWTACWLAGASPDGAGERLTAVLAVARPRDLLQGRRLIASATPVNLARLTDPAVPLREAADG